MTLSPDDKTLTMIKDDGSSGDRLAVAFLHPFAGKIMNMGVVHFTGQFAPNLVTTEDEARRLVVAINKVKNPASQGSSVAAAAPVQPSLPAAPRPGPLGLLVADRPAGAGKVGKPGLMVVKVVAASPAAKAGMKPGDRIVAFNNVHIKHAVELKQDVDNVRKGSVVRLAILRHDRPRTVKVRIPASGPGGTVPAAIGSRPLIVTIQDNCHTTVIADDNCDYDNGTTKAFFAQALNQSLAAHGLAVAGPGAGSGPHLVVTILQVGDNSIDPTGLLCGLICDMAAQASASARYALTDASGRAGPTGTTQTKSSGTRAGLQELAAQIAAAIAGGGHESPATAAK
ncbi:MAG: PDZ domain-containing protein [Hyphomicrobiales bacterium]|nr:PDZ domain-containing protein [Hyphomicrobiales bacterium]